MKILLLAGAIGVLGTAFGCGEDDSGGSPATGGAGGGPGGTSSGGGSGGATGGTGGSVSGGGSGGNAGSGAGAGSGGSAGSGGNAGAGASGGAAGAGGTGGSSFDCTPAAGAVPDLKLTPVASGYTNPLIATSVAGDTARLFIGEQPGVISIVKNGTKLTTPFLDIKTRVKSGGEQGLLGLAFHPSYATNGKLYVHYTANGTTASSGDTMIAEFSRSSTDPDKADPASEKLILTVDQPEANHNGGDIHFGPDGMLYIGLGDGGGGGDNHGTIGNGQDLGALLGKILRIDPSNPAGGKPYGIPSGNMTGAGVKPEIWSYGLRNPWRWTFDACTNDMYIGDVGQNKLEEIDVEPKAKGSGTNYGWRVMEGTACYNPATGCDKTGKALPVAEYDHGLGCSVTGGYVYRGKGIAGLRGSYLYADFCSGRFWRFQYAGGVANGITEITSVINPSKLSISSFGQDAVGELYVTSFNGGVYRIDPK